MRHIPPVCIGPRTTYFTRAACGQILRRVRGGYCIGSRCQRKKHCFHHDYWWHRGAVAFGDRRYRQGNGIRHRFHRYRISDSPRNTRDTEPFRLHRSGCSFRAAFMGRHLPLRSAAHHRSRRQCAQPASCARTDREELIMNRMPFTAMPRLRSAARATVAKTLSGYMRGGATSRIRRLI